MFLECIFSGNDEREHLARAFQIAHGDVKTMKDGDESLVGRDIKEREADFIDYYHTFFAGIMAEDKTINIGYKWIFENTFNDNGNVVFKLATNTAAYSPLCYLVYAVVYFVTSMFGVSIGIKYLLMRLFAFFTYYFITLYAIRKSRLAKLPISIILLCPSVVLKFAIVTADAYSICVSILFFCPYF